MDGASDRHAASADFDTALDLEAIEHEIAQLWHPDARGDDPITSLATRTSVLNLVIYAPDDATAERVQQATERLSQVHPCRVILFNRLPGTTQKRVAPDIYATCQADSDQGTAPCIERIRIPVTPKMYRQLSTLVQPLIIPELPAYLWWPTTPSVSDPVFVALARASNHTVIDSLRFVSTQQLGEITELEAQLPARAAIADLNWHRLKPWRELTAQFFDIRRVQWALTCVRDVEIDAGRSDDDSLPSQALLLASWLAHCLNWEPREARRVRNDRWYLGFQDQFAQRVEVTIRTRPAGEAYCGHLLAMSMNAQNTQGDVSTLSLSRSKGSSLIRLHARAGLASELHHAVHHPLLPEEALLMPILESTVRDHVFDSSLAKAVETMDLFATPEAT